MCGFIGFTGTTRDNEKLIKNMTSRIVYRGPDDEGFYIGGSVTLGFRRLSIIDLSCESQPIHSPDMRFSLVYNGEIYNYISLRDELISKGHVFKTNCDTEVLLHGYMEYGADIVSRIRGMFAFAVWDDAEKKLFCARDMFGIKPFYYAAVGNNIIFGSEIKAMLEHPELVPEVNPEALRPYLSFQYSSGDETFFRGIYKLPPAHTLTFHDGKTEISRYWKADFTPPRFYKAGERFRRGA